MVLVAVTLPPPNADIYIMRYILNLANTHGYGIIVELCITGLTVSHRWHTIGV